MGGSKNAPVEEGDELNVEIEVLGTKGDGIAKVEGFTIFVPGTKVEEKHLVRIKKVLRNFAFAEVKENG